MEKNSKTLISMVYPMLICFFNFCFVTAFVKDNQEVLQLISIIMTIVFGTLFFCGIIFNILHIIINNKKQSN